MTQLPHTTETRGEGSIWHMDEDERRTAIAIRAAAGARRTLGRRDYIRVEPTPAPLYPKPEITIPPGTRPWKRILFEVAIEHGIPVTLILGDQRRDPIKIARHHAMYRMSTETTMSLAEIGRRLNRDHTTVMSGIKAHKKRAGISHG